MTAEALVRRRRHRARRRPDVFRVSEHPPKPRPARARRPARTRRPGSWRISKKFCIAEDTPANCRRVKTALSRQLFPKPDRRHHQLREKTRHSEIAETIRARGGTSDLSARRRGVSRTALCRKRLRRSALTVPGAAERVIYTGTLHQTFATGARVGFGLLPEPLFTAVAAHQGQSRFRHGEFVATTLRPRTGIGSFTTNRWRSCKSVTHTRRA